MVRNFRSMTAYKRWLAYGHIHKVFEDTPGNQRIKIRGRAHKVKHSR